MVDDTNPIMPYKEWDEDHVTRLYLATNAFGHHLFRTARAQARKQIPETASPEARNLAETAIDNALWGCMNVIDGFYRHQLDDTHSGEYVLVMNVQNAKHEVVEIIDMAPAGPGLAGGYAGWIQGDFGQYEESWPPEKP